MSGIPTNAAHKKWLKKMAPHEERHREAKGKGWQPIDTIPFNFPVLLVIDTGAVSEYGRSQGWEQYHTWAGALYLYPGKRKPIWGTIDDDVRCFQGTPVAWMPFPEIPKPLSEDNSQTFTSY